MSSIGYLKLLYERIFLGGDECKSEVRGLLDAPMFLPSEHIWETVVPNCVAAFAFVTMVYSVSFYLVDPLLPKASSESVNVRLLRRRKLCYQITNFAMNFCLGTAGLYFNAQIPEFPTPTESIQLLPRKQNDTSFFAAFQLAYQAWSIYVGLVYVKEDAIMIAHHFGVINDSVLMIFFTNGMRYWGPFMFGCMELSSVPLAVMNAFKDNDEFVNRYPDVYLFVRTLFAIVFLYVRVWMLVPRSFLMCYDNLILWIGSTHLWYQLFNLSTIVSTMFLTFLQLKWGWIIFKSLCKLYYRLLEQLLCMMTKTKLKSD